MTKSCVLKITIARGARARLHMLVAERMQEGRLVHRHAFTSAAAAAATFGAFLVLLLLRLFSLSKLHKRNFSKDGRAYDLKRKESKKPTKLQSNSLRFI